MSRNPSHRLEPVRARSTAKRVAAVVGVIALVAVAFVGGLVLAHRSSSPGQSAASSTTNGGSSSSSSTGGSSGSTGSSGRQGGNDNGHVAYTGGQVVALQSSAPYAYVGSDGPEKTGTTPPKTLPVVVSISSTKNLTDGQVIAIHAQPTAKSQMYGFEARLCAPKASFQVEFDFYPTQTGNCISKPLSSDSQAHGIVQAGAPYQSADLRFRVGEGTNTYTDVDGKKISITCGPDHPCQLVLLLQVPYGFGFEAFPLTFK
jgi:hypothetical protein